MPEAGARSESGGSLRELDWRFLLGRATWRQVAWQGKAASGTALAAIAGSTIEASMAAPGTSDLAVGDDPDTTALHLLARALEPSGRVVVRWSARSRRDRDEGLLGAAGLERIADYLPFPDPAIRRWIPCDDPAAIAWLRDDTLRDGRSPRRRLAWLRWNLRRRLGRLPRLVVARPLDALSPPASSPPASWPPALDRSSELGAILATSTAPLAPGGRSFVLLTGGRDDANKIVGLVIDPVDGPVAAAKIPRIAAAEAGLVNEREVLIALASNGLGPSQGVPGVLGSGRLADGRPVLVETYLAGRPVSGLRDLRAFEELAEQGADWLVRLATRTVGTAGAASRSERAQRILDEATTGPAAVRLEAGRRARLLAEVDRLPVTVEHRDFAPWNLLRASDGRLAVLDWESADMAGWPGLDLAYLLAYLAFDLSGARTVTRQQGAYRRLRDPRTPTGAIASAVFAGYARKIEIPPDVIGTLHALAWAIHLRSEKTRAARRADGRSGGREPGLFATLLAAELADQV